MTLTAGTTAVAYADKGQLDRAIQDYDQAIRLNPNDADAFTNRGVDYADKGQYDRAVQDYNQAIRLDPNSAKAFTNRGRAYRALGEQASRLGLMRTSLVLTI